MYLVPGLGNHFLTVPIATGNEAAFSDAAWVCYVGVSNRIGHHKLLSHMHVTFSVTGKSLHLNSNVKKSHQKHLGDMQIFLKRKEVNHIYEFKLLIHSGKWHRYLNMYA